MISKSSQSIIASARFTVWLVAAAILLSSCFERIDEGVLGSEKSEIRRPLEFVDAGTFKPSPREECRRRIDAVIQIEESKALKAYYEALPQILVGARIAPVIYLREPQAQMTSQARVMWAKMDKGFKTSRYIKRLLAEHKDNKKLLRDLFLRDGYLFENRPWVALALIKTVVLTDLFDEETIFGSRDGEVVEYTRTDEGYVDAEGVSTSLVLNDRFGLSPQELEKPLHLDLLRVREVTGARRVLPLKISSNVAVVRLVYPNDFEVDALLSVESGKTTVSCIDGDDLKVREAHLDAHVFWEWVDSLFETASEMVLERPGFDEPKDEPDEVQEDGKLRIEWKKAYYKWQSKFKHREEDYPVYDRRGNPTPPQVCIDFIFDTWERASGTWYRKRGERPGRTKGYLNFTKLENLYTRHTGSVLEFAESELGIFDRIDFPKKRRVPFKKRKKFAASVAENADQIREGDLLVIHGIREEDMEEHFHTMMVLKTEPLTGVPMIVSDNAGRPRIRNIVSAMRSAPRRSIKYRLRINPHWLAEQRAIFTSSAIQPLENSPTH